MGDAHSEPAADADAEVPETEVELLGAGHYDQDPAHVLRGLPHVLREPRARLAADTGLHPRITPRAGAEI